MIYTPETHIASGKQFYDIISIDGKTESQRELDINFYLFTLSEFSSLIEKTGYDILDIYGNYDRTAFDEMTSPFMIFRLKRSQQ